jgi:hypothetical protein
MLFLTSVSGFTSVEVKLVPGKIDDTISIFTSVYYSYFSSRYASKLLVTASALDLKQFGQPVIIKPSAFNAVAKNVRHVHITTYWLHIVVGINLIRTSIQG